MEKKGGNVEEREGGGRRRPHLLRLPQQRLDVCGMEKKGEKWRRGKGGGGGGLHTCSACLSSDLMCVGLREKGGKVEERGGGSQRRPHLFRLRQQRLNAQQLRQVVDVQRL
eukprot:139470-Chlamydomonas_euryale.AAC.1